MQHTINPKWNQESRVSPLLVQDLPFNPILQCVCWIVQLEHNIFQIQFVFYLYLYPAKCRHMVSAHKMLKESWIQINSKLTLLDAMHNVQSPSLGRYNSQTSTDHNGHIINTPLVEHSGWSAKTQLIATMGFFRLLSHHNASTPFFPSRTTLPASDLTQVSPP